MLVDIVVIVSDAQTQTNSVFVAVSQSLFVILFLQVEWSTVGLCLRVRFTEMKLNY